MNKTVDKVISEQLTMPVHSLETEDRRSTAVFKFASTFLFRRCSIRTGSCQSSLLSNSGIFPFRAFSRIRRSRSKETRSLYLIKLRTFSLGCMTAKNEVDAYLRDSQNAFSFDSASLCSYCNRLISFYISDIFSFCSLSNHKEGGAGQGGEVHLGLVCPDLWQFPQILERIAERGVRASFSRVALRSSSSAFDNNTSFNWTFSGNSVFAWSKVDRSGFTVDVEAQVKLLSNERGHLLI